ncbi:MAG: hypothetical protein GEU28_02980 [Dehalococcoidia bacterium]|nr:hypothetical protein [Dehalococcoidia bacterium]
MNDEDDTPIRSPEDAVRDARVVLNAALTNEPPVDMRWIAEERRGSSTWAMAQDALEFVGRLMFHLNPRHVIEFGSGVSTCVIERATEHYTIDCRISVIENDPKYARLTASKTGKRVAVQLAPLVARSRQGHVLPSYEIRRGRLASTLPADFLLIDGPPAALGGREGILYQALEFARAGSIVLLDDATREPEVQALERWGADLHDAIQIDLLPGFEKGLASTIVRKPASGRERVALNERRASTMQRSR